MQSTAKDCYGFQTKGGHISIQSQLLPGALHSSARWQLNEPNRQPWNHLISWGLEGFRKQRKREEMVIRDKWEQLCENWSVIWGRKSNPYLSQNFSTLFKVLINVLNPSKPNLFQISHKSNTGGLLCLLKYTMNAELWLSDWIKSLGPTEPTHKWGDGRFVIHEKLKFSEIYIAFSQGDNLTKRPINRKYEGNVGVGTGNTKREDKDMKQERRERTHGHWTSKTSGKVKNNGIPLIPGH